MSRDKKPVVKDAWSNALCGPCLAAGKKVLAHRMTKPPTCADHYEEILYRRSAQISENGVHKLRKIGPPHVKGNSGRRALSLDKVQAIRDDYQSGMTMFQVAVKYGVSTQTVFRKCRDISKLQRSRRNRRSVPPKPYLPAPSPPVVDWRGEPFV